MGKTLTDIAQRLPGGAGKKVQQSNAIHEHGQDSRLSRAVKAELIAPKAESEEAQASDLAAKKILYYSAFTEDLCYWDNGLAAGCRAQVENPTQRVHQMGTRRARSGSEHYDDLSELHQRKAGTAVQRGLGFGGSVFI
jgi:hypothetical protein